MKKSTNRYTVRNVPKDLYLRQLTKQRGSSLNQTITDELTACLVAHVITKTSIVASGLKLGRVISLA